MKLILDKNFIQETEKYTKEQEKVIKFKGWTADGEEIELIDMESNKIAPIVRFLAEGKKNKLSWLLIWWAGFLMLVFFGLLMYLMTSWSTTQVVWQPAKITKEIVIDKKPVVEIIKTETETETEKATSWSLELLNEVDMFKDMKDSAEIETIKMSYELDRTKLQVNELLKDKEKLTLMVNNLEGENLKLKTREVEGATDEFIYYLWDMTYSRCKKPTTPEKIENCKTLYFNFLEYGENR